MAGSRVAAAGGQGPQALVVQALVVQALVASQADRSAGPWKSSRASANASSCSSGSAGIWAVVASLMRPQRGCVSSDRDCLPWRRSSAKQPCHAQIFIKAGPVDAEASAGNFPALTLPWSADQGSCVERLSRAGVSCSSCGVLVCLRSRWRQESLSKPHNLQTHAQGCISRHREMQSIQRA